MRIVPQLILTGSVLGGEHGNSQSMSMPLTLYWLIQDLTLRTNLAREALLAAILEKYSLGKFQPASETG